MSHLHQDRLIRLALGDEPLTGDDSAHLDGCERCTDELAALRHVAGLGVETDDLRQLPAPPARVWSAIAAGTGSQLVAEPLARPALHHPVRPIRRLRPLVRLALVALVGVLVGVAATVGVTALRSHGARPATTVVASGAFAPKAPAARSASGTATVVQTGSGRQLRIAVTGMPAPSGLYEAWLYSPSSGAMIPLGAMSPAGGQFPVDGFDLSAYSVVDVSAQTFDGAEGHGTTMLQAPLR